MIQITSSISAYSARMRKMQTRITPNTDTFYVVNALEVFSKAKKIIRFFVKLIGKQLSPSLLLYSKDPPAQNLVKFF